MKVVVTGAAGFLGARLAAALLAPGCALRVSELLLVDTLVSAPAVPAAASHVRVRSLSVDLAAPGAAERIVEPDTAVLFHLAAIVSGHAERDFDLGLKVNFDATRALLEAARQRAPALVFVMSSTVGVLGGELPPVVDGEDAAPKPQSSYGCAKAMAELLASEYGRRGFCDTRVLRLPTVSVRGGGANQAVTSFASGVVREPLAGLEAVLPVGPEQELWLAGPAGVVRNLLHAAVLPAAAWAPRRVLALPGLTVSVREMVAALGRVCGAAAAARVRWERQPELAAMVATFPPRLDASRALALGFAQDRSFDDLIREYIRDDLGGRLP